jgi:hypothetical protein
MRLWFYGENMASRIVKISLPPAARGALFEKTAPLDPPQKLLIIRRLKRRLKASIPGVQTIFHQLHDIRYFDAFAAGSVRLKKPLGSPKGFIGPPCHGG